MCRCIEPSDVLEGIFCDSSISILRDIFEQANDKKNNDNLLPLKEELLGVLQTEMSRGMQAWDISPSGENHLICSGHLCFLINVYGIIVIFSSWLIWEGELTIAHSHWIENDHIVIFDKVYIVHQEKEEVICHYSNDTEAFVHFGVKEKIEETDSSNVPNDDIDLGDWL